jgi:outer membrane protein assembly factor BamB
MAVQGGKDGIIRLLNRAHLGGVHGELQDLQAPGAVLFSAPAVWRGPGGGTWVYLGDGGNVTALRLVTNAHGVSRLVVAWTAPVAGTSPVVSGGLVFVSGSGALSALDARSGRILWSSTQASAGGTIGDIHWESPVAVNGRVYISDQASHLTAYALPGR